jgi:hypothetical protein
MFPKTGSGGWSQGRGGGLQELEGGRPKIAQIGVGSDQQVGIDGRWRAFRQAIPRRTKCSGSIRIPVAIGAATNQPNRVVENDTLGPRPMVS